MALHDPARMKLALAVDGGPASREALHLLVRVAQADAVEVTVLSVAPHGVQTLEHIPDLLDPIVDRRAHARGVIRIAVSELLSHGFNAKGFLLEGRPGPELTRAVYEHDYELIVLGAGSRSVVKGATIGSVSMHVLDHAPCSVLVVHPPVGTTTQHPTRVVVATDGHRHAQRATAWASRFFDRTKVEMKAISVLAPEPVLVTVAPGAYVPLMDPEIRDHLRKRTEWAADRAMATLETAGFTASSVVADGPVAPTLETLASDWNADLVVVGTRGLGRVKRMMLGSVAHALTRRAPATLVVRGPQSISLGTHDRKERRVLAAPAR